MKALLNRIRTIDVISIMIIAVGFAFLWNSDASDVVKGQVQQLMVMVAAFYFSASLRSAKKDETIQELSKNQKE